MSERKQCYGCLELRVYPDAAGGGTYKCELLGGLVLGEWGHWTDERDQPRAVCRGKDYRAKEESDV